jgi:hypothetical protein
LEARSSPLARGQRDSSGAARKIDYTLSYGTVHVADIVYDKQFYCKTVALGPIVKIARNADDQSLIHPNLTGRRRARASYHTHG